jgi:redox-sensitive bicupin YhaK (pirin superfamily)
VAALRAGQEIVHKGRPKGKAYLFVISGSLTVNGIPLVAGDQGRAADEPELRLTTAKEAEIILLDLP